jgi:F-type H+-transporting ATPase subunit a
MRFVAISHNQPRPSGSFVRWLALVAVLISMVGWSTQAFAQEGKEHDVKVEAVHSAAAAEGHGASAAEGHGAEEHAEHGLPAKAVELTAFKIGPLSVTNSMIVTWIVALVIILFARRATKNMKEVPEGAQGRWEWMVESLRDFLETIIGRDLTRRTFWFFATVFIFILFTNWAGLIPGIGTIGWGTPTAEGMHITKPLFRGANADLNMTGAMAVIFFICWIYWAIQSNGIGGMFVHLFGNPARKEMSGGLAFLMSIVFIMVGLLEVVSIMFRPVSLSFRLYGNIFAGENLLEAMSGIVPALAPIVPVPFYFMELLVGFVQALVFMLLTAVFTLLICQHSDEHGHDLDH